ncbi:TonB-dependent receptor [Cryomorpha ignava]|uniref:TonB-dependent receptor n=1 Tax=Cryomorpha ignava TaxID=101383 RepID=A0A7K3WSY0_9FLAO|nr:TonB-dependent receptor [Cryomorpha ignava]NEN24800.1 TonB-dependent receptor [Cryomorpha ignava]
MRILAFVVCFFVLDTCWSQISEQDSIEFQELSGLNLIEALKYLDRNYEIKFSYNPDAVKDIVVPEITDSVYSIDVFLKICLRSSKIDYEYTADTYILYPRQSQPPLKKKTFTISGQVIDKNTRESLPFASIAVPSTKLTATTNTDGKFTLMNIPGDTLAVQINYLGYMPLIITLRDKTSDEILIFEMIPQQRNLPSIQVIANIQQLIDINSIPSQFTFNPAQISNLPNLGENDVFSALRRLPGIRGGLDASSGLKIRGGASDHNLVMFDGITVYHVDHFYGFLSAFNTNVIKNIQIDKGGYSAKYGGRASGVVNITGIDGNKINPGLIAEVTTLSANVRAELPIVPNKASLVFAYRRSFTDVFQSTTYKNLFNNIFNSSIPTTDNNTIDVFGGSQEPRYVFSDLNAKVNFMPSAKDVISLSYYQGSDDVKINFEGSRESLTRKAVDDTNWGTRGGSLKWSRKWNKRFFTYANYGVSLYKSDLQAEDSYFFMNSDTLFSRIFYMQQNKVNDNTLRLDNTFEINSETRLDFGYWNSDYEITVQAQNQNIIVQDSISKARLQAVYGELNREIGKWNLSGGLRASYYTGTDELLLEPRLSVTYPLSDALELKGAYGIFHQIIRRLNERSLYLSIPETWTLSGNKTVPILTSNHYILGFLYAKNNWQFDVEGYHKYESGTVDFLLPEFGFATGDLNQFNIGGNRKILGLDVLVKRSFRNQNVLLNYTFLDSQSKYKGVNNDAYFRSSGISAHEFNAVYNFEVKRWDFSIAFVLSSGEPYTPVLGTFVVTLPNGDEQQFVSLGALNSERLDWYNRMDIAVNYTVPLKKGVFQVGASIYNVYNNLGIKYIDYYQIPDDGSDFYSLGQRDILSLGFTPSLFLKVKF